jgi:hypothetical protein
MFWGISINRTWTFIPFIGGMFRDTAKIFAIFVIPVFVFAALWMKKHRTSRFFVALCLVLSTCHFYFVSDMKEKTQIANIELPDSYLQMRGLLRSSEQERALLLPTPNFFHAYKWAKGVQVSNHFRIAIDIPVISDEFYPARVIPTKYFDSIEAVLSSDCKIAHSQAKYLGITLIVLQKDIEGIPEETVNMIHTSLIECFGQPKVTTRELEQFEIRGSQSWMVLESLDDQTTLQGSIRSVPIGFRICTDAPSSLVIKETNAHRTYFNLDSLSQINSSVNASGWAEWKLSKSGCYSLINLHSLVQAVSLLLSLATIGLLIVWITINKRKAASGISPQN